MIKLVAIDLDDTLLNGKLAISPRTADAIRQAMDKGVIVTLATGRMYQSALTYALELGLDVPLITYHGALVKTSLSKEVLYHRPVPLHLARKVVDYTVGKGLDINIYMSDELYVQAGNKHVDEYIKISNVDFYTVPDLRAALQTEPHKILVMDAEETINRLGEELRAITGGQLHITKSKPFFLEITHPEANKGKALETMAKNLGIEQEEVMAIGDSYNDLEMIKYAGIGVAMGNARAEIQKAADFVTCSNDEHGVAEAICRFVL